ncbi:unnamed protein product [Adineta ricciae]|uniref:F-box domain-containing protein n=1 Tax=Adineta ricciae TaxID=249248 RepID=A0A813QR38_ADIRI|nr:unnamed protein product [Adineta ricciae]
MTHCILDLPNEILSMIAFHVIDGTWKNDVRDFVSFTSTCRRLHTLSHDERYWHKMALRRDPNNERPIDHLTWLDYCKKIYLMRTILRNDMKDTVSQYNEDYVCTIQKVLLFPGKIRIYIDERGDNSLGSIQEPTTSTVALVDPDMCYYNENERLLPDGSEFSIADTRSQYLGFLDYSVTLTAEHMDKTFIFRYGHYGYSVARLFELDKTFIDRHNLSPLIKPNINNE